MAPVEAPTALSPLDAMIARINAAVSVAESGDSIDLNRVKLLLSPANDQAATSHLLEALCYFSATLCSPSCSASRAAVLRSFIREAIHMDFASVLATRAAEDSSAAPDLTDPVPPVEGKSSPTKRVAFCASTSPSLPEGASLPPSPSASSDGITITRPAVSEELVESYRSFLRNSVSADSAFVNDVLSVCARQLFRLPLPAFDNVVAASHDVIPRILATYSHAETMCVNIFGERYPHPVRPAAEHRSYARGVLAVALYAPTNSLASSLLSIVIEKLSVIDAMVPDVFEIPSCSELSREKLLSLSEAVLPAADAPAVYELDPEAEKMDLGLVEFFSFADALSTLPEQPRKRRFNAIVSAVERYVLPAHLAKHSPMILLYSASVLGRQSALQVVERLRVSFFDPTLPNRLRCVYLQYSAALVCRASVVTVTDTFAWLKRLTTWLHLYIDERRNESIAIDVDVHDRFYSGVFALMSVVSSRLDVFGSNCGSDSGSTDVANNLRFLRIMASDLNPLLVMPPKLVASFCKAVEGHGDMCFDQVLDENKAKVLPSMTRFGNRNRFAAFMPLGQCNLPLTKVLLKPFYNVSSRSRTRRSIGSLNSICRSSVPVKRLSRKRTFIVDESSQDVEQSEEAASKRRRKV
jgi:RNA polymerase I specific transcription initiation factor RRN3